MDPPARGSAAAANRSAGATAAAAAGQGEETSAGRHAAAADVLTRPRGARTRWRPAGAPSRRARDRSRQGRRLACRCSCPRCLTPIPTCARWPRSRSASSAMRSAEAALVPLLTDASPRVRGRAAEALGLIGAKGAAAAIGQMVAEYARSAAVAGMQPDDEAASIAPEAEAFKLGLFALVRLKAYDPIAGGRPHGQPAGDDVVAGGVRAAAGRRSAGGARAAATARSQRALHARVRRPRPRHPQGRVGGEAAHRPARSRREGRGRADGRGDPRARSARGDGCGRFARAAGRHANRAPQHPPRGGEGARAGSARPTGWRWCRICWTDEWPDLRAAALRAAAAIDQESFMVVLAGLEPDRHWRVRTALAETLGTLPAEQRNRTAAHRCCRTRTSVSSRRC